MTMLGAREYLKTYLAAMGIDIELTDLEYRYGIAVGKERQYQAVIQGRSDQHGLEGDPAQKHIKGALGEIACAKALGIYYLPTINTYRKGGDVGRYQVRTRTEVDQELLVRTDADDNDIYILVRGSEKHYKVVGWLLAGDAKRPDWLHPHGNREPAYFVPDTFLHEMATLPK